MEPVGVLHLHDWIATIATTHRSLLQIELVGYLDSAPVVEITKTS